MEKIEVLLKKDLSGVFDTPKKLNRSNRAIDQSIIDDLENGVFTCEAIDKLALNYPIFKYRTCITVHGGWPEISRTRIGGYKNVHQNMNGSVEVRYSAIDKEKIVAIATGINGVGCNFRFNENSNERGFYWMHPIATKQDIIDGQMLMQPIAEKLTALNVYGHVSIFTARDFFRNYLVLALVPLAVPQTEAEKIILTLCAMDKDTHAAKRAEFVERLAKETKERQERWENEKRARAAKALLLQSQVENEFKPLIAHLSECNDITRGILVKVSIQVATEKPVFVYVRKTGNGSFGRIKWQKAISETFSADLNSLVWKDCKQQTFSEMKLQNYRLFQGVQIKKAA